VGRARTHLSHSIALESALFLYEKEEAFGTSKNRSRKINKIKKTASIGGSLFSRPVSDNSLLRAQKDRRPTGLSKKRGAGKSPSPEQKTQHRAPLFCSRSGTKPALVEGIRADKFQKLKEGFQPAVKGRASQHRRAAGKKSQNETPIPGLVGDKRNTCGC